MSLLLFYVNDYFEWTKREQKDLDHACRSIYLQNQYIPKVVKHGAEYSFQTEQGVFSCGIIDEKKTYHETNNNKVFKY